MSFLEELYQKGYHPSEHDRPHSMEYGEKANTYFEWDSAIEEWLWTGP